MDEVDDLISRVNAGDAQAREALFATAYPALRELARARLRESGGRAEGLHTTQLVHESYLRLARGTRLRAEAGRPFCSSRHRSCARSSSTRCASRAPARR